MSWQPDGTAGAWADEVNESDAVVNLAGEGIADRRWTDARKRTLEQSRILSTRSLVAAISRATRRPSVLVSGSAVGYYGDTGDRTNGIRSAGNDFWRSSGGLGTRGPKGRSARLPCESDSTGIAGAGRRR